MALLSIRGPPLFFTEVQSADNHTGAFYPESSQRTLEEIDLLFSASTPWAWDAEKKFAQLKAEKPELVQATHVEKHAADDPEVGSVKDAQVVQKE